jgi:hypothetical protein
MTRGKEGKRGVLPFSSEEKLLLSCASVLEEGEE